MAIKINTTSTELERMLKKAIYENKMALITKADSLGAHQVSYIKGYITCLEEVLSQVSSMNKKEQENIYKICLN